MRYYLLLALTLLLTACHDYDEWEDNGRDNILALWSVLDEHYCFFEEKNVDWDSVKTVYMSKLESKMKYTDYFQICSDMVNELKDGHVNLSTPIGTSYYREWWSNYPQDFNLRTLQQYYLNFDYYTLGGIYYKLLPSGIAYIYDSSFSYSMGDGNWDNILSYFSDAPALIIDIRNNGGGDLSNVHTLVSHLITETQIGGYMVHKTGKGHSDFSEPYAVEYKTVGGNHLVWDTAKPIIILTNRACYSSANDFVAVMKYMPNLRIVGAKTGGGGAMPFTYDLPMGWSVRLSVSPLYDKEMNSVEAGIDPTPGCEVTSPDEELAQGKDAILDFAVTLLSNELSLNDSE